MFILADVSEEALMSDIERMTVVFPEPMAAQIRAAVAAGEYASTSEAVREAVRLWSNTRQLRHEEIEALRRAWDRGKASGLAGPLDMKAIIQEAKAEMPTAPTSNRD
jgi:antitoxin ParD1/3/4